MQRNRMVPTLAVVFGGIVSLAGAVSVCAYLWYAVIARWGEGDQSLLFWYLPFLLFGVLGVSLGLRSCSWGRRTL